jgi:hypothetical protein
LVVVTKKFLLLLFASLWLFDGHMSLRAQESPQASCRRPSPGSAVPDPEDLRSYNGVLKVDLTVRNFTAPDGTKRFCYSDAAGNQSPTLRLNPGDLLILHLKNDMTGSSAAVPAAGNSRYHNHGHATAVEKQSTRATAARCR